MSSKECLVTWSDHQMNVMAAFGRFLDKNCLVDCTIAAEGQYLKAHRLLLSASSSYFELLFSQETERNTIVVLKDIKFEDLKSLIAFVYQGRVTVSEDRLQDFVSAANFLHIKGLSSGLLNNNSENRTNELSEVSGKGGSASCVPPECMRSCSAASEGGTDTQCVHCNTSSTERCSGPSSGVQSDLSEENVFTQHQSVMSDSQTETTLLLPDAESSAEVKVEVEDTSMWDSEEEENTYTVFSSIASATAGEGNQNESSQVLDSVSCESASRSLVSENNSELDVQKCSVVSTTTADSGSKSPVVLNVSTECNSVKMEDSSSSMQGVFVENGLCTDKEFVVKIECAAMPLALSSHTENLEESENEMQEEMESWENEEELAERVTNNVQDLDEAVTCHDNGHTESTFPFKVFAVPCMAIQNTGKEDNSQKLNVEQLQIEEHEREYESTDILDSAVDNHRNKSRKSLKCPECPNVFCAADILQTHIKELHSRKLMYRCKMCMATFASHSRLLRHVCKQAGKRSFQCDVCKSFFSEKRNLIIHFRKHTGERPFQCNRCDLSFRDKSQLTLHMRTHTGERPYQCDVCKLCFSQSSSLTRHMRIHDGERPFQCEVCKMTFNDKSSLTVHMRKHTGERPFHCDICNKSFIKSSHLIDHRRKHTGQRPYKCHVCKLSFRDTYQMNSHMRIHGASRPFQCDVCKKSFNNRKSFNKHMQRHSGKHPYQCDVCKKSFTYNVSFTRHMRMHTL